MGTERLVYARPNENGHALGGHRIDSPGLTPHSDPVVPPPFSSPGPGTKSAGPGLFDPFALDVDGLAKTLLDSFRFPSADLVGAAAALFAPGESGPQRRQSSPFQLVAPSTWSESATGWHEGSWPILEIGPGMLRYRRRDASARDRARLREIREGDKRWRYRARELELLRVPIWRNSLFDEPLDGASAVARYRAAITEWTARSQANLIRAILSLDLASMLADGRPPAMVTLTLPDAWLDLAPDGAQARRLFERFRARWARRWGAPSWIWKREFQDRGAPHWHLWVIPPTEDLREFKAWLSLAWTESLKISDPIERAKSRAHGAHLSLAEGLRASDPKRLAVYFLKESGPSAAKAYQNKVPAAWSGEVVGRFWGVAGISKSVAAAELDPAHMDTVWRILRKIRESHTRYRTATVNRVNSRTGEIRRRKVNRRYRVRATAGWIALNDGPAAAAQIARYLATLDPPSASSL